MVPNPAVVPARRVSEPSLSAVRALVSLLVLVLVLSGSRLEAQITVTSAASFPVAGDHLQFATDPAGAATVARTPPGSDQFWDLSQLQADAQQEIVYLPPNVGVGAASFPAAQLLIKLDANTEGYYKVTSSKLELLGTYGIQVLTGKPDGVIYSPPLLEMQSPMQFFDISQNSTNALVEYPVEQLTASVRQSIPGTENGTIDAVRFRLSIQRLTTVDAWGTLAIPGGTFPVLRQKRIEYRDTRIDVHAPPLGWISLSGVPGAQAGLEGTTYGLEYRFHSDVATGPIAVITFSCDEEYCISPVAVQATYKNLTSGETTTSSTTLVPTTSTFATTTSTFATTTSTFATTTSTSVTGSSSTTTTLPLDSELCGNCVDDDGDGLTDLEDPDCCTRGVLTVSKLRLKPSKKVPDATIVRLTMTLADPGVATLDPTKQDSVVQLHRRGGTPDYCARVPASAVIGKKGKSYKFVDKAGAETSAAGITKLVIRRKNGGVLRAVLAAKAATFATPTPGPLAITVGFAGPDGKSQCVGVESQLTARGEKGELRAR